MNKGISVDSVYELEKGDVVNYWTDSVDGERMLDEESIKRIDGEFLYLNEHTTRHFSEVQLANKILPRLIEGEVVGVENFRFNYVQVPKTFASGTQVLVKEKLKTI